MISTLQFALLGEWDRWQVDRPGAGLDERLAHLGDAAAEMREVLGGYAEEAASSGATDVFVCRELCDDLPLPAVLTVRWHGEHPPLDAQTKISHLLGEGSGDEHLRVERLTDLGNSPIIRAIWRTPTTEPLTGGVDSVAIALVTYWVFVEGAPVVTLTFAAGLAETLEGALGVFDVIAGSLSTT